MKIEEGTKILAHINETAPEHRVEFCSTIGVENLSELIGMYKMGMHAVERAKEDGRICWQTVWEASDVSISELEVIRHTLKSQTATEKETEPKKKDFILTRSHGLVSTEEYAELMRK